MPLKHLEHDGNEEFLTNREEITKLEKKIVKDIENETEQMLEKLQEQWLDMNNPFLWDGEI